MLLHSHRDFRPQRGYHRAPPLPFGRRPPQSNYPPYMVQTPDNGAMLELQMLQGGISLMTNLALAS